mmetsp:Transcript_8442/g.16350  ORF Transcript_8442/g.16350 Transcript_8442/m.16350 type:complete len:101 (-) Transcript_8442:1112-1414(-)
MFYNSFQFTKITHDFIFTIDKIFDYELFGNYKLFFQKKKCKFLNIIIISGEKVLRADLKSVIYKITKSFLNVIEYQFLLYGSGYSEMIIFFFLNYLSILQ